MSATTEAYKKMFGNIETEVSAMPKCACVACNSCTCGCSCRVEDTGDFEW